MFQTKNQVFTISALNMVMVWIVWKLYHVHKILKHTNGENCVFLEYLFVYYYFFEKQQND